jgi:serine/threonine protein kinase
LKKPDNVGFHQDDDTVKLFDFGLAKELQDSERDENGLYRMTGVTGTIPIRKVASTSLKVRTY